MIAHPDIPLNGVHEPGEVSSLLVWGLFLEGGFNESATP